MAQLTVPVVFDHDDLQRMVNEKIAEVKAQFIPKDQYENRLKADMVAILKELKEQLREMHEDFYETEHFDEAYGVSDSMDIIQQKINILIGEKGD